MHWLFIRYNFYQMMARVAQGRRREASRTLCYDRHDLIKIISYYRSLGTSAMFISGRLRDIISKLMADLREHFFAVSHLFKPLLLTDGA